MAKFTLDQLKELMKEIDMLRDKVDFLDPNKDLATQGIDSLDMLSVFLLLQEKFNIEIPDEDIPKLNTLNAIVEYVNQKMENN
ncbi:MAG: acyl carrier protein [Aquificae bacterium]|nr:acyl carrier protein [Aquificota bacterium]